MLAKDLLNISNTNGFASCINELFNPNYIHYEMNSYDDIILKCIKYINADYISLSKINVDKDKLDSLSECNKDEILEAYSLPPSGNSSYGKFLSMPTFFYSEDENDFFLKNSKSFDSEIKSYYRLIVFGLKSNPVGIISAFYKNTISDVKSYEFLLYMIAYKIGAIIDYNDNYKRLKNKELEILVYNDELIRRKKEINRISGQLKKASIKADESNLLKSSFLANLSHEIRTPMNSIIGFAEILREKGLSEEEKEEYLDIIYNNGNQLMNVMDALIEVSKQQVKVLSDELKKINVIDFLNNIHIKALKQIKIKQKKISVNIVTNNNDDFIITYQDALNVVFEQLIDNAIKFTNEGEIKIGYYIDEKNIEFYIKP